MMMKRLSPGVRTLFVAVGGCAFPETQKTTKGESITKRTLEISRFTAHEGCDWVYCWIHPVFAVSGERVRLFQSLLEIRHPDCSSEYSLLRSDDGGKTWSDLLVVEGLRGFSRDGQRLWYALSRIEPFGENRFLAIGKTIHYSVDGKILDTLSKPFSAVYDLAENKWSAPECFDIDLGKPCLIRSDPQIVREGEDYLIPFYVHFPDERKEKVYSAFSLNCHAVVVRCRIDASGKVTPCEKSELLTLDVPRGFCEPALCKFNGKYFMTLRNDKSGYIVSSDDWRKWPAPKKLEFDDGEWLGNYNTMTKLLELGGKLYLIYTRKGLNNDHVFRHRAPLMIAELDPATLRVIRSTEQIVIPEYGARLGNFSVTKLSSSRACLAVAEWAGIHTEERERGAKNRIWFAVIKAN